MNHRDERDREDEMVVSDVPVSASYLYALSFPLSFALTQRMITRKGVEDSKRENRRER